MRRAGILAGGLVLAALAALWWSRSADRKAELAGHLRCLVVVGQVLRQNDGHWPTDLVATARTLPEMTAHLAAAESISGRTMESLVTYHRPTPSDPPGRAIVSAAFHDCRIGIAVDGTVTITPDNPTR